MRADVLTMDTMKTVTFWDETPRSFAERYRHFGRTCCLCLPGWKVKTKAAGFSETLVTNSETKINHIPGDHNPSCSVSFFKIYFKDMWPVRATEVVIGITTRYGLGGPGIEYRSGRDFPHLSRPALGPTKPPIQSGAYLGLGRLGSCLGR